MNQAQKLLLLLGGALIVGGVVLGFVRPAYDANGVRCGTAFSEDLESQFGATLGPMSVLPECEEPLSDAKVLPWLLIGGGAVATIGALVARSSLSAKASTES